MYTDINEIYPVTIVSVGQMHNNNTACYYAFNRLANGLPDPDTMLRRLNDDGEYEYIRKIDKFIEDEHLIIGRGYSIKAACKDLVDNLNTAEAD